MIKKILSLIFMVVSTSICFAYTVAQEGAWCWFADPRAMHHATPDGRVNMSYVGYIDIHGNIKAMQYDFTQNKQTEVMVRSYFQPDDHDNPTFLALPDGRIMVMYSRHTDEPCIYYRISQIPADITTLGDEHVIATDHNTTYPSPFILSDDPDHIYLCWRGINWHPTLAVLSMPDAEDNMEVVKGPYQIVQSTGARPYAKYVSNGKDKIFLTYTTGHPDNESPNYLYYNYVDINNLGLYDIAGHKLSSVPQGPMAVDKSDEFAAKYPDMVVDSSPYRDWVWQVTLDARNRPTIAMTRISTDKKSHNYYIARHNGKEWTKSMIAHGGGHFHQSKDIEHCYSGGMALDTENPGVVYCSVPVTGAHGRVYEIVKYTFDTNGEVTSMTPVTSNSEKNNSRPYCLNAPDDSPLRLMWMHGDYYDWIVSQQRPLGYCTSIQADFTGFTPELFGPLPKSDIPEVSLPYKFRPDENFSLSATLAPANAGDKGVLLSIGDLIYAIDTSTLKPEIRYKKKTYISTNMLATADSWARQPQGTNGKWYTPVAIKEFVLKLVYSDGMLTTYVNGVADQSVRLAPAKAADKAFEVIKPDYKLSPFTGLTRRHWIEAAEYLLGGAFEYISDIDDAMYFPKQLDKTYPHDANGVKVAKIEGLARTLFIAAPLLRENPGLTLNGIKVADYYRHHLLSLLNPESQYGVKPVPSGPTQTLLELGSLAMSLEIAKDVLWDGMSKSERDALATLFKSYGEGPTISSNWQFFNVFLLSFLKENGYDINEEYLTTRLTNLLKLYRGEGWYNDVPAYDYYSMWAFQTYGPLWAHLFGQKQRPELAEEFFKHQADLVDNYPYMFAADGRMNMWGRSIPYRFACTAPFAMLPYGEGADNINYGWLREISSASLLQFLENPEFMDNDVPSMGFYGVFAPCVQVYSCRGSVYWMGKAFFNLLLPEDSPYWTAVENRGPWETELKKGYVYNKLQPATSLLITNYPNIGGSEMRSWCHETKASDWQKFRSSENYNKLAYHTEFPWMADAADGVFSMNYATLNSLGEWEPLRLYEFKSFEDGVYRRDAVLESDENVKYQLADIPLPDGTLRIDRVTVPSSTEVHLGSYSLPELSRGLKAEDRDGAKIVSNSEYTVAVLPLAGWDTSNVATPAGVHPVSSRCGLVVTSANIPGTKILVSLQLWAKGKSIDSKSLRQISSVDIAPDNSSVTVTFASGDKKTVKF